MPAAKPSSIASTSPRPVTKTTFRVDPFYAGTGNRRPRYQGLFQFGCTVALPADPHAVPAEPAPPARWLKPMPLVLELSAGSEDQSLLSTDLPLSKVVTISCFENPKARAPLVVVDATRDAFYQKTSRFSVATDRGAYITITEHLRTVLPATLATRILEAPLTEITVVGSDEQGRTVLVETINGTPGTGAVYAEGMAVSVLTDRSYSWLTEDGWPTASTVAFDAPLGLRDDDSQPEVPGSQKRKHPAVLELRCLTPAGRTPALPEVALTHVFADNWRLLASIPKSACHYRNDADQKRSWSVDKLTEHLRFGLGAGIARKMRGAPRWKGHLIGVDADGRTVVSDSICVTP